MSTHINEEQGLPGGWLLTSLGEIADIIRGVTYKKEDSSLEVSSGLIPILRATNIGNGLDFEELVYVPPNNVSDEQFLRLNDIVIAASSGSRAIVGKAAILCSEWRGSFGAFCYVLRPNPLVNSRLLAYFLQTSEYRNQVSNLSAGVNINNLRREHIESIPYRLAPNREQPRIVAKLDEQFTRLDVAVTALRRVQANLKRYRAAVLKAACEGRLVPTEAELARREGHPYEPASVLLECLLTERRSNWENAQHAKTISRSERIESDDWKKKYPTPEIADTANLRKLPDGWIWASLDQLFAVERGRFSVRPRNDPRYYGGSHPFVQIGDLPREGGPIREYQQTLNEKGLLVSKMFNVGTVLIAIVGATIANTGVLTFDSCCPDSLVGLQSNRKIVLQFAEIYLRSVKLELRRTSYASGGQPNINLAMLQPYPIPLPPHEELQRIVSEVERQFSVIDELVH